MKTEIMMPYEVNDEINKLKEHAIYNQYSLEYDKYQAYLFENYTAYLTYFPIVASNLSHYDITLKNYLFNLKLFSTKYEKFHFYSTSHFATYFLDTKKEIGKNLTYFQNFNAQLIHFINFDIFNLNAILSQKNLTTNDILNTKTILVYEDLYHIYFCSVSFSTFNDLNESELTKYIMQHAIFVLKNDISYLHYTTLYFKDNNTYQILQDHNLFLVQDKDNIYLSLNNHFDSYSAEQFLTFLDHLKGHKPQNKAFFNAISFQNAYLSLNLSMLKTHNGYDSISSYVCLFNLIYLYALFLEWMKSPNAIRNKISEFYKLYEITNDIKTNKLYSVLRTLKENKHVFIDALNADVLTLL